MHRFWIFTCEIVHQFNENLGPNLLKGRGTKELEQLKNWVATSKNVAITEKKSRTICRQMKYTNQGPLPTEITPDIDFPDEPVVPYDVPIAEKKLLAIPNT